MVDMNISILIEGSTSFDSNAACFVASASGSGRSAVYVGDPGHGRNGELSYGEMGSS